MKKFFVLLAVVLALLCVTAAFSSCGGNGKTGSDSTMNQTAPSGEDTPTSPTTTDEQTPTTRPPRPGSETTAPSVETQKGNDAAIGGPSSEDLPIIWD